MRTISLAVSIAMENKRVMKKHTMNIVIVVITWFVRYLAHRELVYVENESKFRYFFAASFAFFGEIVAHFFHQPN